MHLIPAFLAGWPFLVSALPTPDACDGVCYPKTNTAQCQAWGERPEWDHYAITIGVVYNHGVGCDAVYKTLATKIGKPETPRAGCTDVICEWECIMISGAALPTEEQPGGGGIMDKGTALSFYAPPGRKVSVRL